VSRGCPRRRIKLTRNSWSQRPRNPKGTHRCWQLQPTSPRFGQGPSWRAKLIWGLETGIVWAPQGTRLLGRNKLQVRHGSTANICRRSTGSEDYNFFFLVVSFWDLLPPFQAPGDEHANKRRYVLYCSLDSSPIATRAPSVDGGFCHSGLRSGQEEPSLEGNGNEKLPLPLLSALGLLVPATLSGVSLPSAAPSVSLLWNLFIPPHKSLGSTKAVLDGLRGSSYQSTPVSHVVSKPPSSLSTQEVRSTVHLRGPDGGSAACRGLNASNCKIGLVWRQLVSLPDTAAVCLE